MELRRIGVTKGPQIKLKIRERRIEGMGVQKRGNLGERRKVKREK